MQPLEEAVEIVVGRDHDRPPTRREDTAVLGRGQVLRCAPPLRAPSATWPQPPRGWGGAAIVVGRSSSKGNDGDGGLEVVRDVLRADGLLGRGRARRRRAGRRRRAFAASAWSCSTSRTHVCGRRCDELGEVREGRGAEGQQMLPLQIAPGALAGHRGDALRAMLRQGRALARAPIAARARR